MYNEEHVRGCEGCSGNGVWGGGGGEVEGEGKEKIGMSSELKRCGGRRVRMDSEDGG